MGMFNYIELKDSQFCPKCGEELTGWQSKGVWYAKYPIENLLISIKVNSRISCETHDLCENCNEWIELEIVKGKVIGRKHRPAGYSSKSS